MSRFSMSDREGGLLDGLKARLGFAEEEPASRHAGASRTRSSRAPRSYEDDSDFGDPSEYAEEFAEYGPDYDEEEHDSAYDPTYGSYSATTPRARAAAAAAARMGGPATSGDFPRLVSIDDVRASSRRGAAATDSSARAFAEPSTPSYASPRSLAQRDADVRSSGLNSLFPSASVSGDPAVPRPQGAAAGSSEAYDPYKAYEGAASASHAPARSLSVLKPMGYGDVERIAKTLKSGDVVVIVLRNTPDDLAKRILDFSFGVASALDASVECPGDKVFALTRGAALSVAERQALHNQGVL